MPRRTARSVAPAALLILFLLLAALPLGIALLPPTPASRGFLVEFGVALGFAAFSMMGLQFLLSGRTPLLATRIGQDALLQFHRVAGILAALLVVAHAALVVAGDPAFAAFFDPRVNLPRAVALNGVLLALAIVVGASLLRRRLGLPYERWRLVHGALSVFAMVVGLAHVQMVGRLVDGPLKRAAFAGLAIAPIALFLHARVIAPLRRRRLGWRVVEVRPERERVWTIVLDRPGADFRFRPGQFVWATFGASPLALRQHPFTIASSAERRDRIDLTIKELGDFTRTIGSLPVGSLAFLEGPSGAFTLPDDADRILLVAGGIGITPMMSILRTMADRSDPRPATLVYGNASLGRAVFRRELDALATRMDLRVVHVTEAGDPGTERGMIDAALLDRLAPDDALARSHVLVCGPEAMMDAVETELLARGLPRSRILSERFDLV